MTILTVLKVQANYIVLYFLDYRENYSLYYERRLRNKDECSPRESDQWIDHTLPSGVTYFSKVRLEVHSLKVIIDDFTFAHTSGRKPQPFGSAGDCFSTTKRCPRGAFSINFENTKFRLKPNTHWDTRGTDVTQHFYDVSAHTFSLSRGVVNMFDVKILIFELISMYFPFTV